jgi:hypothetical protein
MDSELIGNSNCNAKALENGLKRTSITVAVILGGLFEASGNAAELLVAY